MKTRILVSIVAALLATAFAAGALAQDKTPKLYKWVDKQGVVHYGSSVPPQYAHQQLQVLNSQGVTVKTLNAAKTPEQLAKEKQAQTTAKVESKQEQQQHAMDQMLLDTYTSVASIEQDRDSRLKAMGAQINVTKTAISGLQSSLAGYKKQEATLNQHHRAIPAKLKENMSSTEQQLKTDKELLGQQAQLRQATEKRFDAYIKRFQELTQAKGGGND